jgi:hypothetical protein
MGLPSSIRATANPLIQSMDLAGETKKQPFWQHGGTILLDSQAATIKGHCYMWLSWLPILHRHTSCGSPIMHGCTNSRLHFCFQGTTEPYQIRATLKDPVLNAKVYTQQAMLPNSLAATSRPALIQRMAEMQTHTLAKNNHFMPRGCTGKTGQHLGASKTSHNRCPSSALPSTPLRSSTTHSASRDRCSRPRRASCEPHCGAQQKPS